MSKLITTSRLARFWTNTKSYIDTALAGKANASHTHDYAATTHAHAQADITGLTDALAGKAAASHTHTDYAAASHGHAYADLTGKPAIPTTVAQLTDAGDYAKKSEVPALDIATEAEIDALFS